MRVKVERSGGFAGRVVCGEADTDHLDHLDDDAAARLRELASAVDVRALAPEQAQEQGTRAGADRFQYAVEIDGDRVELGEGALPPELRSLVELVLRPPRG